ncbi:N-acetyltransferase Eis [subsurface metagenome]
MGLEIRAASADEMEEFVRVVSTAFVGAGQDLERIRRVPPEYTLCVFKDGKIATTYIADPFAMSFNGNEAPGVMIDAVSTLPIYRRRGYLRKLVTNHFERLHEQGEQSMAILWGDRAAIYQRYGYAIVATCNAYNTEPRYLEFTLAQAIPGAFREVGNDNFRLVELYQGFRAERTGYLHRTPLLWETSILAPPPRGGFLGKVVYEEEGKPLGYLVYTIERVDSPEYRQGLIIRDLVWLETSAYQAMWSYLNHMDNVGNILWKNVPPDDPLPHLLLEPRMLNVTSGDGIMARIVDVEQALTLRRYPVAGTLTFEVLDELCPWNRGHWQLETSATEATARRINMSPQLRMPVSTLAMIIFNQISATEAARMGRLDVLEPSALSLWDMVMRTSYRPFCADRF